MSLPLQPPTTHRHPAPPVDTAPPTRSKITGALAALACAACCALPLLIAAGVLTGAGAAILRQTLLAVAAGLAVLALGMWWWHRRAAATDSGCGESGCDC
jgi:mercuric ion transport protein